MPQSTRLIIADSESCSDLYWATKFFVPDPIFFLEHRGRKTLVASDLEYARAKKEAQVEEVLPLSRYRREAEQKTREVRDIDIFHEVLQGKKIRSLEVPSYFPYRIAAGLLKKGYRLTPIPDPFYPERMAKTPEEKNHIVKSSRVTEEAIRMAIATIKKSRVKSGRLYLGGTLLTSELLRKMMEMKMLEQGCLGRHTIVAGGRQAADPHCIGSGPLLANWPIVLDLFPKSIATGYYADITRTVIKGRPSERLKAMYEAVREAQAKGTSLVRQGVDGATIHRAVTAVFEKRGFRTGLKNGRPQGFIHGTGHGLGLDIHEPPRVNQYPAILEKGYVVTIEPGLYYEDLGGIRIEDDVSVAKTGCEVLTRLPKQFEV